MKCVLCNKYELSLQDRRILTPKPYQMSPAHFECPLCRGDLASTNFSRFLCVVVLVSSLLASGVLIFSFLSNASENITLAVSIVVALTVGYLIDYFVFPRIIKIKKWETLVESLPKSRLVCYLLFLILPISVIFGLLFLGAYFSVGV